MISPQEPSDGLVTLRLGGALDGADVSGTLRQARDLLRPPGVHTLVVDLAAVDLVDSSGLGLLVQLRQLAEDRGAHFLLQHVPTRVGQLLDLTGLMGYLSAE